MQELAQDIRYGFRMLRTRPGFTAIAVIALALGIGANTAIFSMINSVLLRPLPYPEPGRLVMLEENGKDGKSSNTSYATTKDWSERSQSFENISAVRDWSITLTGEGEPEMLHGMRVSSNYFGLLAVKPALGREFLPEEDSPATRRVVILSHGLWERRFGADTQIAGKPISLGGQTFTVAGVMPRGFEDLVAARLFQKADLWAPLGYDASLPWACRTCRHIQAVARLKPGVSIEQAGAEMNGISGTLVQEHPHDYAMAGVTIIPLLDKFVGAVRPALYVLLGAVGLVLLIACANVGNLLLARATQRQKEIAIRSALGARRGRIIRQLLTESLLLSAGGTVVGLILVWWGMELLIALSPTDILRLNEVNVDVRVLGFTLALSLLTGIIFGLAPALQASKIDLNTALKEGARGSTGAGHRMRNLLAVSEIALALVLLVGAGLLVRSFLRVLDVTPGFEAANLVTMNVSANGTRYADDAKVRAFYDEVLQRVAALPGVEAAAVVSNLPLGGNMDQYGFHVEEKPMANPEDAPSAERYVVSPDYLRAMRIPLLAGREFSERDGPTAPLVVLISESTARSIWPNEDPIGKRVRMGGPNGPLRTIVGITGDVTHTGLDTPPGLEAYVPEAQWTSSDMLLVVRTPTDPKPLLETVRNQIWTVDKELPIYRVATMDQLVSASVAQRRFTLVLLSMMALLAATLAALGIYSVMSYSVTQRTQEIGIRMALGAKSSDVLRLVVGQGMLLALGGIVVGLAAAAALTRLMSALLFGISVTDPVTFAAIAVALAVVALGACLVPARRATKLDPMIALRYE
jgi:putative ABC transport system permease protein